MNLKEYTGIALVACSKQNFSPRINDGFISKPQIQIQTNTYTFKQSLISPDF